MPAVAVSSPTPSPPARTSSTARRGSAYPPRRAPVTVMTALMLLFTSLPISPRLAVPMTLAAMATRACAVCLRRRTFAMPIRMRSSRTPSRSVAKSGGAGLPLLRWESCGMMLLLFFGYYLRAVNKISLCSGLFEKVLLLIPICI